MCISVQHPLAGPMPHADKDVAFFGGDSTGANLYYRSEVDALSPFAVTRVPSDIREPSSYEPNLLN